MAKRMRQAESVGDAQASDEPTSSLADVSSSVSGSDAQPVEMRLYRVVDPGVSVVELEATSGADAVRRAVEAGFVDRCNAALCEATLR